MKTALIDADAITFQVACAVQRVDPDSGHLHVEPFEKLAPTIDKIIEEIVEEAECKDYICFLGGDRKLLADANRQAKLEGLPEREYKPNFRYEVAKSKPYKGNRANLEKPVHYENVRAYILGQHPTNVSNGLEADDCIGIESTQRDAEGYVICSQDKDLRMLPGYHFTWSVGNRPGKPLEYITNEGYLKYNGSKGLSGGGMAFFFAQLLLGDTADNIPGLPKCGPVKVKRILEGCKTEKDYLKAVQEAYKAEFGEGWKTVLREQTDLLWITRELDETGERVPYKGGRYWK